MMTLEPAVLTGRFIRLEPHSPALREAVRAALDTDADAWAIMVGNGGGEGFDGWWAEAEREAAQGSRIAFVVRRLSDGVVFGSTSLASIRRPHRGLEIGSTFYRPDARGGAVNPECKLLLLAHAFAAGALRVEIVTDARNTRSRAAIAKLGATEEGVLRKHKTTWRGFVRDTVMFSITDDDWPAVKAGLEARLAAFA